MTITEASHVTTVLRAVAGDTTVGVERLQDAFAYLNQRAGKALQLTQVVHDSHDLDAAAHRITGRNEDAR